MNDKSVNVISSIGRIPKTFRFPAPVFVCTCSDVFVYASVADYANAKTYSVSVSYDIENELVSLEEYRADLQATGKSLGDVLHANGIKKVVITGNSAKLKPAEELLISAIIKTGIKITSM